MHVLKYYYYSLSMINIYVSYTYMAKERCNNSNENSSVF